MIFNYKTLPYREIADLPAEKRRRGNQGTKERRTYVSAVCAFDIETTRLDEDHSIMYIWQFQIESWTCVGRSWTEFKKMLQRLKETRPEGQRFVVWVHNLSFEFQFLRGIYKFSEKEVFLTDARKPLRVDMMDAFEFRCSYRHSNLSLDEYLKKMGVEHKKLTLDYAKIRYPWTPFTDDELAYCVNDVRGLTEAIRKEMTLDKDSLYTVPLTSTGYVRRDAKKALWHCPSGYIKGQLPDMEIFRHLRVAFRGGNTHANRFYSGKILRNVKSYDRSSSYPDVMINCKYPVTPFWILPPDPDVDWVLDLINRRRKAVVCTVRLWKVRLRDPFWGFPYLTIDKCRYRVDRALEAAGLCFDNGRILEADFIETTCTDIDLKIIFQEYDFDDIEFSWAAAARYGELPPDFKRLIITDYKYKTELKGATGDDAVFYGKRKARLNSYYGMTAQSPVRRQYVLRNGEYVEDPTQTAEKQIEEYQKHGWLPYQWGVWTTAWARLRLEEGLRLAGEGAVYTDTDSVKYMGDVDWSAYNAEREAASRASGAWADDPKGNRHYMGVYEFDGEYEEFATLGAKKYAYRENGVLHATISGVNKKAGGVELEKNGGLTAFLTPGFIFREAGGRELKYLDQEDSPVRIDGHKVRRRPCVTINDSTYTLGITEEYDKLLTEVGIFDDFLREKYPENL